MRKPSDLSVYDLAMRRWVEFKCIGCGKWTNRISRPDEGMALISSGARFVRIHMPREKKQETGLMTDGYIFDWSDEADDDPHYVAVLEKEES